MANSRELRVSRRNVYWAIAVIVAGVVGFLLGGWRLAAVCAVALLVVSEVGERIARAKRNAASE